MGCMNCLLCRLKVTGAWSLITMGWILRSDISGMVDVYVYSLAEGVFNHQLSLRPTSLMYCLSVSVECQVLGLLMELDLSRMGFITVLKSPPIIIFECEMLFSEEKKVWKKVGSSVFGPYTFAIVMLLPLIVMLMMTYLPSGSVMVALWINGILLFIKIDTPLFLEL